MNRTSNTNAPAATPEKSKSDCCCGSKHSHEAGSVAEPTVKEAVIKQSVEREKTSVKQSGDVAAVTDPQNPGDLHVVIEFQEA